MCWLTVSCIVQAHPASAAAAAVLVAHASSLGANGNANSKYNADGSSFTGGLNEMEQGMGQGPLGQSRFDPTRDVINVAPLLRQQTHGPVRCRITFLSVCMYALWMCQCTLVCVCVWVYVRVPLQSGLFVLSSGSIASHVHTPRVHLKVYGAAQQVRHLTILSPCW